MYTSRVALMLCEYGCGLESKFKTKGGRNICADSPNKCQNVRKKNSKKLEQAHQDGRCGTSHLTNEIRSKGRLGKFFCKEEFFSVADKPKRHIGSIRAMLFNERGHACEGCSNTEWLGNKIPIELEHINGNNKDNRRENLKLLCPNCHALTPTWRRKKTKPR